MAASSDCKESLLHFAGWRVANGRKLIWQDYLDLLRKMPKKRLFIDISFFSLPKMPKKHLFIDISFSFTSQLSKNNPL